jgi:hypothetical protein
MAGIMTVLSGSMSVMGILVNQHKSRVSLIGSIFTRTLETKHVARV